MSDARLPDLLAHNFNMEALLKQYDDRWLTVKVENEGFFIIRDGKILPIAGAGHYQAWFANEFGIPPGIKPAPAITQSQPVPQQAPADTHDVPELLEKRGILRTVMGGRS